MRARIERAVEAEQISSAADAYERKVKDLLSSLASSVADVASAWSTYKDAFADAELCSDLRYWTKPELPNVVAALCALEQLVEKRNRDNCAAHAEMTPAASTTPARAPHSTTCSSPSALYGDLMERLMVGLVVPVMQAHAASVLSAGAVQKDAGVAVVRVVLSDDAAGLFLPGSVVEIPASVYVGWRCAFRLCDSFQRLLSVSAEDAAAGTLDLCSAMLQCLTETSQAWSQVAVSRRERNEGDHSPFSSTWFTWECNNAVQIAHCWWWWWTVLFAFGSVHGVSLAPPEKVEHEVAGTSHRAGSAAATTITAREDELKVAYMQLWSAGRTLAMRHLSTAVRGSAVCVLSSSITTLLFPSGGFGSTESTEARLSHFHTTVTAARECAQRAFPQVALPSKTVEVAAADSTKLGEGGVLSEVQASAVSDAAACLLRVVVHDALRPVAERILDDPASLQAGAAAKTPAPPIARSLPSQPSSLPPQTVAAAVAAEKWGEDSEEEWEEVQVGSSYKHDGAGAAVDVQKECNAVGSDETVKQSNAQPDDGITCVRDALTYVLDTLEERCGAAVRQDAVVLTLRRLL